MGTAPALNIVPKLLSEHTNSELADLFGAADLKVQQRQNAESQRNKYREELQRRFDLASATENHFVEGLVYSVTLSPRRRERKVKSGWAMYRALGLSIKGFVRLVTDFIPLYFLEERLGKAKAAKLVSDEQTGFRTVSAVQLPQPAAVTVVKAA